MSLKLIDIQTTKKIEPFYALEILVSENLSIKDYNSLFLIIDVLSRKQTIRLMLLLNRLNGWISEALWEDSKFLEKSLSRIDRIAIVGEQYIEQARNFFCKPFINADVRCFNASEVDLARMWIWERIEEDNYETTFTGDNSGDLT